MNPAPQSHQSHQSQQPHHGAREPHRRTIEVDLGGQRVIVEELTHRLCFARKPADLSELTDVGAPKTVWVTETHTLSPEAFDEFAARLLASRAWLAGKGGGWDGMYLCVEVLAPNRPRLYVNPEGTDYARYVARVD